MRIACVLITHLRAKVELRRHPQWQDRPILIVAGPPSQAKLMVVDRFPGAAAVRPGMTLEQALSHHADASVLDADEPQYRRVFGRVLTALQGISDRVEGAELGTAYVRCDGLEGLFGGEAGVVSALLQAVPADLIPRVGMATAKFPAFVAARTSRPRGATTVPDDVRAFLAPHPIDLLPVPTPVQHELHRFGLHTLGAVAALREPLLAERLGPAGRQAWAFCNGSDDRPVVPLAVEEVIVEHTTLPFHSAASEALGVVVDTLLRRAYARPELQGRCAGAADLRCAADGGSPWELSIQFKQPIGAWERASFAIRSRLAVDHPRSPVEDVTLTLSRITGVAATQPGLLPDVRDDGQQWLVAADRRLQALMGGGHALYRIVTVAPWHPAPELRAVLVPLDPAGRDAMRPLHAPLPVAVQEGTAGEPVSLRVARRWQRIVRIADRWAFDLWWLPVPITRDYYRIDAGDDRTVTLFRDRRDDRWYRQVA